MLWLRYFNPSKKLLKGKRVIHGHDPIYMNVIIDHIEKGFASIPLDNGTPMWAKARYTTPPNWGTSVLSIWILSNYLLRETLICSNPTISGTNCSIQRLNTIFKTIKSKYNLKVGNFSTHSLRKTFGREVFNKAGTNAELALVKLSQLFNHSSVMVTRRYLGILRDELLQTYDALTF